MAPHVGHGQTVAKIILFGEHSVVYGHPAIAMPLRTLRMIARVEPTDGPGTLSGLGWTGPITEAPARFSSIVKAAEVASDFAGHPGAGLNISTESEFPPERGLGSSAAAAGAVIRAVLDAFDTPATPRELFDLTQEAETVAHGRPSGLDAVATSAQAPVHFQAGQATDLEFSPDAWIVIADSGVEGSTRETVGHVRARFEAEPDIITALLNRLGEITDEVVVDLRTGDVQGMGARMTEAHGILGQLGVSNTQLDALVTASLGAGALGAKLTGGGRGGCVIALAATEEDAENVEKALVDAGARGTWVHAPATGQMAGEVMQ
ncbi:mevalonate kinase [Corynebacterium variabile]|uniref:mevalonate kinase n=1 Tax=Corynebacterium variabile TaxID=1727 RepID=UPI001DB127C4|nr:mevalonate kinase [Corynebacterium variabile]HJG45789.1 mevalonate kinase [Corynebacterium variabile]